MRGGHVRCRVFSSVEWHLHALSFIAPAEALDTVAPLLPALAQVPDRSRLPRRAVFAADVEMLCLSVERRLA